MNKCFYVLVKSPKRLYWIFIDAYDCNCTLSNLMTEHILKELHVSKYYNKDQPITTDMENVVEFLRKQREKDEERRQREEDKGKFNKLLVKPKQDVENRTSKQNDFENILILKIS